MQKYIIEITKKYTKTIIVEGYDKESADLRAKQKYMNGEIVFTEDDFIAPDFYVMEKIDS